MSYAHTSWLSRGRVACVLLATGLSLAAPSVALPANAQELSKDELNKLRAKFQQATELEQGENWAGALQLFREIGQTRMTPLVRYHIALCEENLGKLVAALGGYKLALADPAATDPDFIKEVEARVEQLQARIPKVKLTRGAGAEAAVIELDGVALGSSQVGSSLPVDPGPHTIVAKAPGFRTMNTTFNAEEASTKTITLKLEKLAPGERDAAGGSPKDSAPRTRSLVLPLALGGVGLAGIGAGTVMTILSSSSFSKAEDTCTGDRTGCDPAFRDEYDQARSFNTASWIGFGIGGAALAAAVPLFIIEMNKPTASADKPSSSRGKPAKKAEKRPKSAHHFTVRELALVPGAAGAQAGASIVGRF